MYIVTSLTYVLCLRLCWVASHDEHANHCHIHLTCIVPPIGSKALSSQQLAEKHQKDDEQCRDLIANWRQHWQERKENGLFTVHVLNEICKAQKISFPGGIRRKKANLENALDNLYQSNNI